MRPIGISFGTYKTAVLELKGGINENVSSLELEGGELIDCKNYMIAEGGYGGYLSVKGYERFDGGILPSTFVTHALTLINCPLAIAEGDLLTGATTGATATALGDGEVISGSYIDGDAVVSVQVLPVDAVLTPDESISSLNGTVGTLSLNEQVTGGTAKYNQGIQFARQQVIPVPGEGNILGLHIFEAKVYAFRKKEGINEIGMYVEDESLGWREVDTSSDPLVYSTSHTFKFANYNFFANTDSYSMFWVDGVNQARMYDGTSVTTIDNTGMSSQGIDAPINIAAHNYHLFLAYRGGSLQFSELGDPLGWDGTVGASEIGLGNEITNLVPGVSSSLLIFLDEGIRVLQGNSIDSFSLEVFSETSGAFANTARRLLGTVFFVDDRGVSTLEAVQEFGNYAANSISQRFKQTLLSNKHTITTCLTSRDLNQYRIFFDDRTAIFVSFEGKEFRGATFIEYTIPVHVAAQGEDKEKRDLLVFGTGDGGGYVYKMDSGTSFDGSAITCRLSTAFYHYGSPRQYKAFKRATLEIAGETGQEFDLKVDFDYNELGSPRTIWYSPSVYTIEGGAIYGQDKWGIMKYGVGIAATNRVPVYIQGIGTNMSYKMVSNETYRKQHIVQNIITDFEPIGRRV